MVAAHFFYCVEVCNLNSFCMEKMVRPIEHQQRGRKKRDMLSFRLDLARELIGILFEAESRRTSSFN